MIVKEIDTSVIDCIKCIFLGPREQGELSYESTCC